MTASTARPIDRSIPASFLADPAFWWAAVAYLLFTVNEVLTKWVYTVEPEISGLSVAFLRTVFAALTFTGLAIASGERIPTDRWTRIAVLVFGLTSAVSTYLFNTSLIFLDYPATGAAIITMSPIVLGIYGSIIARRALSRPEWAALIVGGLGVGVFFADTLIRERGALGVVLMLAAGLTWSIYPAFAGPRGSTLWMFAGTSWIGVALLGLVGAPQLTVPATTGGWIAVVVLGALILGVSTYGCVRAFSLPGGLRWAKLNYAKPSISVVLTLLVFGAAPTLLNLAGTLVITFAVLLPTLWQRYGRG